MVYSSVFLNIIYFFANFLGKIAVIGAQNPPFSGINAAILFSDK